MELKPQSKWSWLVAAYLFLAGLGAGAYVVGVLADLTGGHAWAHMSKVGVFLGFPCVLVGCMFLIGDLGTPVNFWRAWMRPNTSWIARGTLIITIFMVLSFIHTVFWIWPFHQLESAAGARHLIGVLGIIFAFGTMIYTGILLGAARPIAFWSTAMLPLLFLVSALSTGMMSVILVESLTGTAAPGLLPVAAGRAARNGCGALGSRSDRSAPVEVRRAQPGSSSARVSGGFLGPLTSVPA